MRHKWKKIGCILLALSLSFAGCGKIDSKNTEQELPTYAPSEEKTVVNEFEISAENGYHDYKRDISFYGLKEYKSFKNGKITEKPKKGKKYLVLYLSIKNMDDESFYFNENNFSSELDGKNHEHTVIFSDPEPKYVTCFNNVPSQSVLYGFIVWEIPAKWKTLDFKYTGMEGSDGVILNMSLTPENLTKPRDISALEINEGIETLTE